MTIKQDSDGPEQTETKQLTIRVVFRNFNFCVLSCDDLLRLMNQACQ